MAAIIVFCPDSKFISSMAVDGKHMHVSPCPTDLKICYLLLGT